MPTIMLLVGSILCVAFYLYVYFAAESPRKGTLEWVDMYEKPQMTRKILHKLHWTDPFWGAAVLLISCGISIGILACVDVSILKTSLRSGYVFLSLLPGALTTVLVFLTAKLLTGSAGISILSALLTARAIPFDGSDASVVSALLLASLLLLLFWLHHDGVRSWLSLIFSAIFLAVPTIFNSTVLLFSVPWLVAVLSGEILRIKQDDRSPWHLVLTLAAGLLTMTAATVLIFALIWFRVNEVSYLAALSGPGLYEALLHYSLFSMVLQIPDAPALLTTLPSVCLLTAGCMILPAAVTCRKSCTALVLSFWTAAALAIFFCAAVSFVVPMAALVLACVADRIRVRNYPGAAYVAACVPLILTVFTVILIFIGGITL